MLFLLSSLTACSSCEKEVVYVKKPVEVLVPTKCVVPDVNCSFNRNTHTEVISSLLECIIDLKKASEVCK